MIRIVLLAPWVLVWAQKCSPDPKKVGSIHGHCYHIYDSAVSNSLAEKNCGDAYGDLGFVFPRGFTAYFQSGFIGMVHYSVSQWGQYLRCNHAPGSTQYSCLGRTYQLAGKQAMGGGSWYSFPQAGENIQWSQGTDADKSRGCAPKKIRARCYFSLVAKARGHSAGCDQASAAQCAQYMAGADLATEKRLWDDAFWHGACPSASQQDLQEEGEPEGDVTEWQTLGLNPDEVQWGFWRELASNPSSTVNSTSIIVV